MISADETAFAVDDGDIEAYIARVRRAPRVAALLPEFAALVTGRKGAPVCDVPLSKELLGHDRRCLEYADARLRHAGAFNRHFTASVPFVLEEQCRLGAALLDYGAALASERARPLDAYFLGDASGVTGRSLAECGDGRIRTLTCSPNSENKDLFEAGRPNGFAHFFLGPFFDVSPPELVRRGLGQFQGGFDVIVEDTTFQMYGPERHLPLQLAARNLRPDGLFLMLEKFMHQDEAEFARRERQKDDEFKARFFGPGQIIEKRRTIVNEMHRQLATLADCVVAVRGLFDHAVVTWNSGNFHLIAASNEPKHLGRFVAALIPPAIPAAFQYMALPAVLHGAPPPSLAFRPPVP